MTLVVEHSQALRAACDALRAQRLRVGFVPTMGALHAGHMSLVAAARARGAERVVLSIFVNPLQFGPSEDFSKYPRTWDADLALCRAHGVDLVYAPDPRAMYAPGFQTHVEVQQLTQGFEAAARPTHFRGVTTVVAKLFNAVGPCVAMFGRKDYQQWRAIERMARDLDMPVEVVGCPFCASRTGSRCRHAIVTSNRPSARARPRSTRACGAPMPYIAPVNVTLRHSRPRHGRRSPNASTPSTTSASRTPRIFNRSAGSRHYLWC